MTCDIFRIKNLYKTFVSYWHSGWVGSFEAPKKILWPQIPTVSPKHRDASRTARTLAIVWQLGNGWSRGRQLSCQLKVDASSPGRLEGWTQVTRMFWGRVTQKPMPPPSKVLGEFTQKKFTLIFFLVQRSGKWVFWYVFWLESPVDPNNWSALVIPWMIHRM